MVLAVPAAAFAHVKRRDDSLVLSLGPEAEFQMPVVTQCTILCLLLHILATRLIFGRWLTELEMHSYCCLSIFHLPDFTISVTVFEFLFNSNPCDNEEKCQCYLTITATPPIGPCDDCTQLIMLHSQHGKTRLSLCRYLLTYFEHVCASKGSKMVFIVSDLIE